MTVASTRERERNPVTSSPYQILDARDRPRERKREEPMPAWLFYEAVNRKALRGQLETRVRELAEASTEKPRWQKIIEHANSLADESGMSREQFYWMALAQLIEKFENVRISEELNEAYKHIDQEEDLAFLNHMVSHYDPRLADE